jgi:hypothetical protein
LSKETPKNQVLEFEIYAWETVYMRIDILFYNSLYMNHRYQFQNTTSVEIREPNRAKLGNPNTFIAMLVDEF